MSPGFVIEREGATAELACAATGIPSPTLTWLKDGAEIGRSARVSTVSAAAGGRLTIKSVVVGDAGVYTCLFKNPVAQVSHDIRLVVKGASHSACEPRARSCQTSGGGNGCGRGEGGGECAAGGTV